MPTKGSDNVLTSGGLSKYDHEVTRDTFKFELKYTPKSPRQPYPSVKHERKEGTTSLCSLSTMPGYGSGRIHS
ncbi:MtrB/PioB family outer membrane beta-barrel protein [Vibrio sp. M60_M31a]